MPGVPEEGRPVVKFAENTTVAVTKTKQELEVLVTRAGPPRLLLGSGS